jgi:succinate-semialdehyde dehydrogenase/glutarate-semialdehyde dehydrogenase
VKRVTSFLDNAWSAPEGAPQPVADKYSGAEIAAFHETTPEQVERVIAHAQAAFDGPPIAIADRVDILRRVATGIESRADALRDVICAESGQTLAEAAKEVERAALTLRVTAEEATRLHETMVPVGGMPGGAGKLGYLRRKPLGVVVAITAFNSPLNTPVHKIAPALAAGNSVVLKAPSLTPVASTILCDLFAQAGLPPGWLGTVVGAGRTVGEQLLTDPRPAFYHFTGSTEVGAHIARSIGLRRSSLELGSIAATLVAADADLEAVAADIARAGFAKAGQVCTSTQIVYAERAVASDLTALLADRAQALPAGDPRDARIRVGPMISQAEAIRVEDWIRDAALAGADILVGGRRQGSVVEPTVLTNVPDDHRLIRSEVFGPVVTVIPVSDLSEAIAHFNALPYGLAVGVFTNDLQKAFLASERLRAGTVHINSASSSRLDAMPFGGVRESGHGKEGPRYAIEEMTEERLILWHGVTTGHTRAQ